MRPPASRDPDPLAVAPASSAHPTPEQTPLAAPDAPPLVTVVIPALDEEHHIGACLDSVLAQTYPHLEVLVVDGGSRDRTREVVASYAARDRRVRLLDNPERTVPHALNRAVAVCRGRYLVRVDAHATVPADYVARAVAHLSTGRWGGVGGRKDGVGRTPAGRAIAAAMASPFGVGGSRYHYGTSPTTVDHVPFGAYPVDVIRELGGWDPELAVNQDFEFDYRLRRAGYRLLFDPALRIDWECRQSVPALFRQYRRYGRGKTLVVRRHPRSLKPRHLLPPALVVWLTAAVVVAPWQPLVAAAAVAPYLAGVAAASILTAPKVAGWRARAWLPAAFAAMHVGWGLGVWQGIWRQVTGRDPNTGRRRSSPR